MDDEFMAAFMFLALAAPKQDSELSIPPIIPDAASEQQRRH